MKILVISASKTWIVKRLVKEAIRLKVKLVFVRADKLKGIKPRNFDVLYVRNPYVESGAKYLPKVMGLAKAFKKAGKKVIDTNITDGELGLGKWVDYQALKNAHLPIPKTQILSKKTIPKAWPFILKWVYGFKGKNVFYIDNQKEFNSIFLKYPKGELLVQEFVKAQYEYKVITVGYKALPVVLRFNIHPQTHRPDFEKFKVIKSAKLKKIIAIAERASKALGRELSKVDILEQAGKYYVLEVNRFPGLDSFEKLTKYNAVKEFLGYLQKPRNRA